MRGQGGHVPIPTQEELKFAITEEHEIVACSGIRYGQETALNIAFHNGDKSVVLLNEYAALCLFDALKALFPGIVTPNASPAKVRKTEHGIEVQCGHTLE
jgi:hypothetical protein